MSDSSILSQRSGLSNLPTAQSVRSASVPLDPLHKSIHQPFSHPQSAHTYQVPSNHRSLDVLYSSTVLRLIVRRYIDLLHILNNSQPGGRE